MYFELDYISYLSTLFNKNKFLDGDKRTSVNSFVHKTTF